MLVISRIYQFFQSRIPLLRHPLPKYHRRLVLSAMYLDTLYRHSDRVFFTGYWLIVDMPRWRNFGPPHSVSSYRTSALLWCRLCLGPAVPPRKPSLRVPALSLKFNPKLLFITYDTASVAPYATSRTTIMCTLDSPSQSGFWWGGSWWPSSPGFLCHTLWWD